MIENRPVSFLGEDVLRASLIFDVLNVYCVIDVTDKADKAHDKCVLHLDVSVNQCYQNPHIFFGLVLHLLELWQCKKKKKKLYMGLYLMSLQSSVI